MVLQTGCFLVVFSLPFSGKDKGNRSRAGRREKPGHEGDSKRLVSHPKLVPAGNCSGQKLERHPLLACRQQWDG